jgi:hypothetical protein
MVGMSDPPFLLRRIYDAADRMTMGGGFAEPDAYLSAQGEAAQRVRPAAKEVIPSPSLPVIG